MRALTLHVSALNDYEYDSYTDALNDLTADRNNLPTSDDSYDRIAVGVREVRAWLRGRYATVPATDVDVVCSFSVIPLVKTALKRYLDPETFLS